MGVYICIWVCMHMGVYAYGCVYMHMVVYAKGVCVVVVRCRHTYMYCVCIEK